MCAGSDMPPRTSSDGRGIGLIAPLRRSGRDGDDRRTARAARAADRPRADVSAGVAGARPRRSPRTRAPPRARTRSCSRGSCGRRRALAELSSYERCAQRRPRRAAARGRRIEAVETRPSFDPGAGRAGIAPSVREVYVETADRRRARGPARPARRARAAREGSVWRRRRAERRGARALRARRAASASSRSRRRPASTTPCARTASTASSTCWRPPSSRATRRRRSRRPSATRSRSTRRRSRGATARPPPTSSPASRQELFHSIGSCSFFEPVEELEALGMLPLVKGAVGFGVFSVGGGAPRVGFRVAEGMLDLAAAGLGAVFEASDAERVPRARPLVVGGHARSRRRARRRGRRARSARAPRRRICPSRSPTTSTSTRRSSTRRTSDVSSVPTRSRSCRTGATCRSATTGAREPSSSAGRRSCVRAGRSKSPDEDAPRYRAEPAARHRARARLRRRRREPPRRAGAARRRSATTSSASLLVNDWSARDIQAWEYQPLGPFLGKSFATSIAAWVTPLALLEDRFVPPPRAGSRAAPVPPGRGRLVARRRARGRARRAPSSRARTLAASTGRCRSSSRTRP